MIEKYIDNLLSKLELSDEFLGILLYGSYVLNNVDEFSDFDVLIVVENEYRKICGRGNYIINGKSIEFFIKTEDDIYKELNDELEDLEPATRNAFLTGKIIVDYFNVMSRIKERAKEICYMPFKRLNRMEKEAIIINTRNGLKEIERKNKYDDKDYKFSYFNFLYDLIKSYCDNEGIPIRKYKFYKTYTDEDYMIKNLFVNIEDEYIKTEFVFLIEKVDFTRLKALTEYILDKIYNLPMEYRIYRNKDEYFFTNSI